MLFVLKTRCSLRTVWTGLLMGGCITSVSAVAPSSGKDGTAFAIRQAAEAQKEIEKILSQDKNMETLRRRHLSPPSGQSLQALQGIKEQLEHIKVEAAQLIDKGNLLEGLDTKKGCPSRLFNKDGEIRRDCSSKDSPSSQSSNDGKGMAEEQKPPLFVFVSFSMPEVSLKSLARDAERHNAVLVMRGLYEDSFVKTADKLKDLGMDVDINPELFETHHVKAVPTFVLGEPGQPGVVLRGNVSLEFAMKTFKEQTLVNHPSVEPREGQRS